MPSAPSTNAAMEGIAPPMPLLQPESEMMKGMVSRCCSGSHTVPSCCGPGVRESKTRRAMLMCATASPESRIWPHL